MKQDRPLCLFALLFLFLVALLWEWQADAGAHNPLARDGIRDLQNETLLVQGRICEKEISQGKLILHLDEIEIASSDTSIIDTGFSSNSITNQDYFKQNNKIMCNMQNGAESAAIGSRVRLKGRFIPFSCAENEGQFDACSYYGAKGYCGRLVEANLLLILEQKGQGSLSEHILKWKWSARVFLYRHMSEEDASMVSAMVLGDKKDLDVQTKSLYQKSGIAHVLAISGLHISLLGMTLYRLLRRLWLPPFLCSMSAIFVVLIYARMTGGSSSAIRASVMFILVMLADLCRRSYDMLSAMAVSLLVVLVKNPKEISQAGFWLSFAAVMGIAVVLPLLAHERPQNKTQSIWLRYVISPLSVSLSVMVFTLPILLWFYFSVSPYSCLLNLLILPLISLLLPMAIFATLFQIPFLLRPVAFLLQVIEMLCVFFRKLPFSLLILGRPQKWQVMLYYCLLCTGLWMLHRRRKAEKKGNARVREEGGIQELEKRGNTRVRKEGEYKS